MTCIFKVSDYKEYLNYDQKSWFFDQIVTHPWWCAEFLTNLIILQPNNFASSTIQTYPAGSSFLARSCFFKFDHPL